jgi:hypothetical protein
VRGDLPTGEGLGPAVDGVAAIAHCAGSAKGDEDKTRNLGKRTWEELLADRVSGSVTEP